VRASELRFDDLFELCPQKGIFLFRRQRMLLFDADAIGRLRKELIWTLGEDRARGVLTRFGFASGFSHAVQMREMFDWDSDEDWLRAGFCLYSLMGMIQFSAQSFEVDRALGKFHFEAELAKSFEVDTHLQHLGRSKTPVCWILAGFASGYCSAYFGDEVFFLEDQCAARGDSCCHLVGKTREEWGQQLHPHLKFFEEEDIARELQELYQELSRKNRELEETLEALQASEERYRDLFENTSDLIQSMTPEGHFLYVNRAWRERLGYSPEELSKLTVFDIIHPDSLEHCSKVFQQILSGERVRIVEAVFVAKDGAKITVEGTTNCRFVEGKPVSAQGIFRDISDRKRAEEALRKSEHMYRILVDNLPQRVFYKNRDCVYVSCNQDYARDLNIRPDQISGKTDYDFFPEELAEKYRADDRRLMESGETEDIEEKYVQEGKELFVHTVKTPVRDQEGNVIGILGIFSDISDRKRAEEALRQAEEERNRVLEALRGAEKLAVVGEMAGRIAHEVLNPVTALLSRTQAEMDYLEVTSKALRAMTEIVDDWHTNLNQGRLSQYLLQRDQDEGRATFAEQDLAVLSQALRKNSESLHRTRELLSFFEREIGTVVRIVDNLRQMSKSRKEIGEVDLNHCLTQVTELFQEGLSRRHISLNQERAAQVPRVYADYTELFQVFSNLLRNAMLAVEAKKREGGRLTVSPRVMGEEVWVRVADDGMGIPERKQASVFEHDFSAGSGTGETGLDLAISRRLVRGMGGELLLESSSVEEGSVFLVKLPLTKSPESAERYSERVARL
jgi:PAS domain S-box-containing protein